MPENQKIKKVIVAGSGRLRKPLQLLLFRAEIMEMRKKGLAFCVRDLTEMEQELQIQLSWVRASHKKFTPNVRRHGSVSKANFMVNAHLKRFIGLCHEPGIYYFGGDGYDRKDFLMLKDAILEQNGSVCLFEMKPRPKGGTWSTYDTWTMKTWMKDSQGNPSMRENHPMLGTTQDFAEKILSPEKKAFEW